MHTSLSMANLIERQKFVLWKRPFRTIQYFILELFSIAWSFFTRFLIENFEWGLGTFRNWFDHGVMFLNVVMKNVHLIYLNFVCSKNINFFESLYILLF